MPISVWQPVRAKDAGRIERRFRTLAMISRLNSLKPNSDCIRERELATIQKSISIIRMAHVPKIRTIQNNQVSMRDIGFGLRDSGFSLRESGFHRESSFLRESAALMSPRDSIAASVIPASPRAFTPSSTIKGKTQVIILEGDAGVGKSRLVFETEKMFKEKKDKYFYSAANHIDSTTPYHAWRGIFLTILDKDKKIPDNILEQIDVELLPLLNSVLALNIAETPRILQMSAQVRSETTQALLTRILTLVIPSCSLIALINAHW